VKLSPSVSWGATISGQKIYGQTFFDGDILSLEGTD
jgi:hypothetical protein